MPLRLLIFIIGLSLRNNLQQRSKTESQNYIQIFYCQYIAGLNRILSCAKYCYVQECINCTDRQQNTIRCTGLNVMTDSIFFGKLQTCVLLTIVTMLTHLFIVILTFIIHYSGFCPSTIISIF